MIVVKLQLRELKKPVKHVWFCWKIMAHGKDVRYRIYNKKYSLLSYNIKDDKLWLTVEDGLTWMYELHKVWRSDWRSLA